jgi:hypothetical protein
VGFTPRERLIVEALLIDGKSLSQVRHEVRDYNAKMLRPEGGGPAVSYARLRQMFAKVGRKALHYSDRFDAASEARKK